MKKYTKLFTVFLAGVICLSLTACGGFTQDDAKTIVDGSLKSLLYNEYSDDYLKLCDMTKEEAQQEYDDAMDGMADQMVATMGVSAGDISAESLSNLTKVMQDLFGKVKYEIGDVTADGDNYLVTVKIYPVDILQKFQTEDMETYTEDIVNKSAEVSTEAELYQYAIDRLTELLNSRVATTANTDPVTITVHVNVDDEGYYTISDSDTTKIGESLFAQ